MWCSLLLGFLCCFTRYFSFDPYYCTNVVNEERYLEFPPGFSIGAASSVHELLGGWNGTHKSVSHLHNCFYNETTKESPDISCDSNHLRKGDVEVIKKIKLQHYRFSLSWSRILPTGSPQNISQDGVKYYNDLIDDLRSQGIEPFVTIYYWDHPIILESFGGWLNETMVDYFVDYARVVFQEFGSKVKFWGTVNEANRFCHDIYLDMKPGRTRPDLMYGCAHNMLKAHAEVYHMYDKEFRPIQNGKIGIVAVSHYFYPFTENDIISARTAYEFHGGWIINPIFSKDGDYPAVMKQYAKSTLPEFSPELVNLLRGSSDYLGLVHYSSYMAAGAKSDASPVHTFRNFSWPMAFDGENSVYAKGFGDLLRLIKETYDNPPVYILENGIATDVGTEDYTRANFIYNYMKEMLLAINRDGCNIKAYTVFSLLDTNDWNGDYRYATGLVHVDFDHPNRTRTLKQSALWLSNTIEERRLISPRTLQNTTMN